MEKGGAVARASKEIKTGGEIGPFAPRSGSTSPVQLGAAEKAGEVAGASKETSAGWKGDSQRYITDTNSAPVLDNNNEDAEMEDAEASSSGTEVKTQETWE
jgi:hypothetical protein